MKPRVYVPHRIPERGIELLEKHFDVEIGDSDVPPTKEQMIAKLQDKEAVLPLLTNPMTAEIMDACPNLKIISNYAVGYNNIDADAATERGIIVGNTPGVLTDTTADLAFTLLMAAARRVPECDQYCRNDEFKGWLPLLLLGADIHHAKLGIVGFGRIGQTMAKRAMGFDMEISYYDEFRQPEEVEKKYNAKYVPLEELLKESDFVSLHCPLLPSTTHLIGEKELKMMKKSAILVNSARGPIVDEKALCDALRTGEIFSAALDVFEREPVIEEELKKLPNCVLLPHVGSATFETRSRMADISALNIVEAFQGKVPAAIVNKEVIGKTRIKLEK